MFNNLTDSERQSLERIAVGNLSSLRKRALIILKSNGELSQKEIAEEVGYSERTVFRWQRKFLEERLAIFPAETLAEVAAPSNAEVESEVPEPTEVSVEEVVDDDDDNAEAGEQEIISPEEAATKPEDKGPIGLKPTDSLAEAGRKVLRYHYASMLKNEEGTRLGEDIEALHDMRVATRRMRAAFQVFEEGYIERAIRPLQKGLKRTARSLGWVRDWDVFIEKFEHYQTALPEERQSELAPLLEYCHMQRDEARKKMVAYLDSKKYAKFKRRFQKFIDTVGLGAIAIPAGQPMPYQLRHVVPVLVYTRYEAVYAYEPLLEAASFETLHDLRISFKRLRYTLENFEEVLGDECREIIRIIKKMQDHLGDMNDAQVASQFVAEFLDNWKQYRAELPSAGKKKPKVVKQFLREKYAERDTMQQTFPDAWEKFSNPEARRELAAAVGAL